MSIKQFFHFLLGKTFWLNILAMVIAVIAILIGTLNWLNIYTGHGKVEIVPDVKGLQTDESISILRKKGLRYEVVDSVYNKKATPETVVEQLPLPGSRVKRNRIVYLTVNAKNPLTIIVPDVRDISQRQAMAILQGSGFAIGKTSYTPSEYRNLVVDISYSGKSITPGQKLPEGAVIDMIVGQGYSNEMIRMPLLLGLRLEAATSKVLNDALVIGGIFYDTTPEDEEDKSNYIIYKQIPSVHTVVPRGKAIDLYLTKDSSLLEDEPDTTIQEQESIEIDNDDESWF